MKKFHFNNNKPILVLFDIDGTILKFKNRIAGKIFISILNKIFDVEIDKSTLPDFSGATDLYIITEIAKLNKIHINRIHSNIDFVWESLYKEFVLWSDTDTVQLLPGVKELLEDLDNYNHFQLGLLTGNFKQNAYLKLDVYNLSKYFVFGAFGSDYADRNLLPPVAIQRANEFIGSNIYNSNNTIIIGDSPRDIFCAKANNIKVLSVATGNFSAEKLEEFNPDAIINSFEDVEDVENFVNGV